MEYKINRSGSHAIDQAVEKLKEIYSEKTATKAIEKAILYVANRKAHEDKLYKELEAKYLKLNDLKVSVYDFLNAQNNMIKNLKESI